MPAPMTTTRAWLGTDAMAHPLRCQVYSTLRNGQRYARCETTLGSAPPPRRVKATALMPELGSGDALQPGVDLLWVVVDPLLGRFLLVHAVLGDVLRHQVLIVVGPLEVLDQLRGRATRLHELLAGDLVQVVRRVVARDLFWVRVAAGLVRREIHLDQ